VINFHDWPLNREADGVWKKADAKQRKTWLQSGMVPADYPDPVAVDYPDLLAILEEKVKPDRTRKKENGEFALRYPLYLRWWIYGDKRPKLYSTIAGMGRVLACGLVTTHLSFGFANLPVVFMHKLAVFPFDKGKNFALLQSSIHEIWTRHYSSTLAVALNYSPSDCFETFPFPLNLSGLDAIGERYYTHRQTLMQTRREGLTTTYNRFHNAHDRAPDIQQLRELHVEMDQAVAAAYGWQDLALDHDFHDTKQGIRFTVAEAARRELLDRLLALNHQRHREEVEEEQQGRKLR